MITEKIQNTQQVSEGNPQSFNTNKIDVQKQQQKYVLFENYKCLAKIGGGSYQQVLLTIGFDGQQGYIIYKRKKQKFEVSCSKIDKVRDDAKKVIIVFNQNIQAISKEKIYTLNIKFQTEEKAQRCKKELLKLAKTKQQSELSKLKENNNQKFFKSLKNEHSNPQRVQFLLQKKKSETTYAKIYCKELSEKQEYLKKSLKSSIKNNSVQEDQTMAIQITKLVDEREIAIKELNLMKVLLKQTQKQLQFQKSQNKRMSQRLMEKNKHEETILNLNKKVAELEEQIRQTQFQKINLDKSFKKQFAIQKEKYEVKVKQFQEIIKNLKLTIIKLQAYKEINNGLTNLKQKLQDQNKKLNERVAKYQQVEKNYQYLLKEYSKLQTKYHLVVQQSQKNEINKQQTISLQQYQKLQHAYNQMQYLHIFQGPVLEEYLQYKQFLKVSIQKLTKKKIVKTKILYKLDKKSNINFHQYVDGHQNFAVIAKTIAGMFIAGFSQSQVKAKEIANKGGLILSLTNYRAFELIRNMRSVTYDDFFMIFGNSEIRIKSQENKVFSNFGTNNAYYNAEGESINILLGEGTVRQTFLENYEFHQVIFQN